MFAQEESSAFYSGYDARELVKNKKYKGVEFGPDEIGDEFSVSTLPKYKGIDVAPEEMGSEKSKSISYAGRIQTTGDDAFKIDDFLKWLAAETIKQIESGKGTVVRQNHKVGRRFYLEYTQKGFAGRIEVYCDLIEKDQIHLDIEIIERSKK
ncbi:MAG: hypothetical protein WAL47_00010 [Pyrinomonadaceae bacterium]